MLIQGNLLKSQNDTDFTKILKHALFVLE